MVVSSIFYVHPHLREMIQFDEHIFSGLKPPHQLAQILFSLYDFFKPWNFIQAKNLPSALPAKYM